MRRVLLLGLAAVALNAAACGSDSGKPSNGSGSGGSGSDPAAGAVETLPRPAVFGDLATVELVSPGRSNAGVAPTFVWKAFTGASSYRLSVLAPDGPTWAWTGGTTSIRYGGVEEGVPGPALRAGSWWSVAAFGSDDTVIAMSELRAVSPGSDPGPEPEWTEVKPATVGGASPTDEPGGETMGERICDLASTDEITGLIKGTWGAGTGETYPTGTAGRCEWTSEKGSLFSISVLGADAYDPEGWDADGEVEDLGSKAYFAKSVWDYRIGFVSGDRSVTLVIDYTRVDQAGFADLARLVESRLR